MAIAASMLTAVYHTLRCNLTYCDLGAVSVTWVLRGGDSGSLTRRRTLVPTEREMSTEQTHAGCSRCRAGAGSCLALGTRAARYSREATGQVEHAASRRVLDLAKSGRVTSGAISGILTTRRSSDRRGTPPRGACAAAPGRRRTRPGGAVRCHPQGPGCRSAHPRTRSSSAAQPFGTVRRRRRRGARPSRRRPWRTGHQAGPNRSGPGRSAPRARTRRAGHKAGGDGPGSRVSLAPADGIAPGRDSGG